MIKSLFVDRKEPGLGKKICNWTRGFFQMISVGRDHMNAQQDELL